MVAFNLYCYIVITIQLGAYPPCESYIYIYTILKWIIMGFIINYFNFLFDFNENRPNLLSPASSVVYTFQHFVAEWKAKTLAIFTLYRVLCFSFFSLSLPLSLSTAIICLCETFRNVRKWFQTSRSHYGCILLLYTYVCVHIYSTYTLYALYTYKCIIYVYLRL